MIPPGLNSEKCSCGYTFNSVALESRHPIIHHSKTTKDSRNSELSIHFLKTSHCDCKSYYHGENERLVRTSSAPSTKQNSSVHFVSVDFLNEYMCSLFGKSQEGKCFYHKQKHFELIRKGRGHGWRSFKKSFSQSIWNLDTCHSIQHRRCIWVQQMSWRTVERRKWRRLWNHNLLRSSHIERYRHGKHAISDKGTDWSRPLPSSKTDHRCALLHHLLTILCHHF